MNHEEVRATEKNGGLADHESGGDATTMVHQVISPSLSASGQACHYPSFSENGHATLSEVLARRLFGRGIFCLYQQRRR